MRVVDAIIQVLKKEGIDYLSCFPTTPVIEAAAQADGRPNSVGGHPRTRGAHLPGRALGGGDRRAPRRRPGPGAALRRRGRAAASPRPLRT